MNILEMYEKQNKLQSEVNNVLDMKKSLIEKIKSLPSDENAQEVKDTNDEVETLNDKFERLSKELETLSSQIKEKEQNQAETAEQNQAENAEQENLGGSKNMNNNYLETKEAAIDFAKSFIKFNKTTSDTFYQSWHNKLITKGITNPEVLAPTPVVNAINDVVLNTKNSFFDRLPKATMLVDKIVFNDNDTIQAYGHKPGNNKIEQIINLTPREISTDYVYKIIYIDRLTIEKTSDELNLVDYIVKELAANIIKAIERAIITGDGLQPTDEKHISTIKPILNDEWTSKVEVKNEAELLDALIAESAKLSSRDDLIMVTSPTLKAKMQVMRDQNGNYIFPFGSSIDSVLGLNGIFTPSFIKDDVIIIFDAKAYRVIGKHEIQFDKKFNLDNNKYAFLSEYLIGGALVKKEAAVAITYNPTVTEV